MDVTELIKDIKWWAGINDNDTTTYTIDEIIRNLNFNLDLVILKEMRVSGTWQVSDRNDGNINIAYNNLEAGQDNYTLGTSMIRIERVRIKDSNGSWRTLTPRDRRTLNDTDLDSTGTPAYYDKIGSSVMPYPTPNYSYTGGIEVQFQTGATYLTANDLSVIPGIAPISLRLLSLMTALDFTEVNEMESRSAKIRNRIQELGQENESLYSTRDMDEVPRITMAGDSRGFRDNFYQ